MVNKTKKILFIALLALTFASLFADGTSNKLLVDKSNFLTESLFNEINQMLKDFAAKGKTELVIVLTPDTADKTPEAFADDYFDYNGYGIGAEKEGALLLIVTGENRYAHISTHGSKTIDTISDARIESLLDALIDGGLSYGDYEEGLKSFITKFDDYIFNRLSFVEALAGMGAAALAFVKRFFGTKKKYKLKEAAPQYNTAKNAFSALNDFEDKLISKNTVSRIIQTSSSSGGGSSTHTSSSGETHGGGGRSF